MSWVRERGGDSQVQLYIWLPMHRHRMPLPSKTPRGSTGSDDAAEAAKVASDPSSRSISAACAEGEWQ